MSEPALQRIEPGKPVAEAPTNAVESLMQMICRVAADPSVNLDRFDKLMERHERLAAIQAERDFKDAMARTQEAIRVVVADKSNTSTKSKYASYAALDAMARPLYTKAGFSVTFDTADCEKADYIRVLAFVSNAGHERPYHLDIPCDGKGAKGGDVMTKTHAVMSAVSYGRRGLLTLIFNIATADKWDDDGNAAGGAVRPAITAVQAKQLRDEMRDRGVNEEQFCEYVGIETLEGLAADIFEQSLAKVRLKRKAVGARDAG